MIYGVGVDLVSINRMAKVLDRWGPRFLNRVFTPHEVEFALKRRRPASAFALRFAAKEAFSKAVGLGMRMGIRWKDIEVLNDPRGKPYLKLYGFAQELCLRGEIRGVHLSLSDEGDQAIAMVVLEKGDAFG